MDFSAAERAAMWRALQLAQTPGVPLGPNPRVGCVLLTSDEVVVGEGFHQGAGTPHAEVMALRQAGPAAAGGTAVVTLEPCNHTGRTGPCAQALVTAGIRRVVYAQSDPNPVASGGAQSLATAGVSTASGLLERQATRVNRAWTFGIHSQRPLVTWKYAATLDGFSAASDGSSKWITSPTSRIDAHRHRAESDVILVGTNTVLSDDPQLTVRDELDQPIGHQPLRAIMGLRDLPARSRILDDSAPTTRLLTRDPLAALGELYAQGRRHVFLEGGPSLASAFLRAGLVDEVLGYLAPKLLGSGSSVTADLGINNIASALDFVIDEVITIGSGSDTNIKVTMKRST